jgi:hypothetical protein
VLTYDKLRDTLRKGENISTATAWEVLGRYSGAMEANDHGVQLRSRDGKAGAKTVRIDAGVKEEFDHQNFLR